MLGEWYLPPGECQVILPIKKGTISISHHAISPLRRGFPKPHLCKQITRTPLNLPGPQIRRSEARDWAANPLLGRSDPRATSLDGETWPGRRFTRSTHKPLKIRTESIARLPGKLVL